MGSKATWFVGGVTLVAGIAVARLHADVRAQASDIERLEAQIASAPIDTAPSVAPQTTVIHVMTSAAPAPSAPPHVEREPAVDETDTRMESAPSAQKTACETSFQREARDASWAGATQPKLLADLKERLSTSTSVRSLECRSAMCRLEMSSADALALEVDLRQILIARPAWLGPTFTTTLETLATGEVISVAYLVRDGHTLPTVL